jgi:hypothetical protein
VRPRSIETVQIRPVILALPAPAPPVEGPVSLSADQRRERAMLSATLNCDVRVDILLSLMSGDCSPQGGRANVEGMAERLGLAVGKVSGHLRLLEMRGFAQLAKEGREHWYTAASGRVRLDRQPDGRFALTLFAREGGGGVAMTVTVPPPM